MALNLARGVPGRAPANVCNLHSVQLKGVIAKCWREGREGHLVWWIEASVEAKDAEDSGKVFGKV